MGDPRAREALPSQINPHYLRKLLDVFQVRTSLSSTYFRQHCLLVYITLRHWLLVYILARKASCNSELATSLPITITALSPF